MILETKNALGDRTGHSSRDQGLQFHASALLSQATAKYREECW